MKFKGKVIFACMFEKKSFELNFVSFLTDLGACLVCKVNLLLEQNMKVQEGSKNLDILFL